MGDTDAAATVIENAAISAKTIQCALIGWIRMKANVIAMGNVYLLGSPWECDVISVSARCYFHEFEIKISVNDLKSDFLKCHNYLLNSFTHDSRKKHDVYASRHAIIVGERFPRIIPKPRKFFFVVPSGLIDACRIPPHCGLIEYDAERSRYTYGVRVLRDAPSLRSPTKLDQRQIFNLAVKAASRFNWQG